MDCTDFLYIGSKAEIIDPKNFHCVEFGPPLFYSKD